MNGTKLLLSAILLFSFFSKINSQKVEKADSLLLMQEYEKAYIQYKDFLATSRRPKKEVVFNAGRCAYLLGKYSEAIELLQKLKKKKNPQKDLLLANAYLKSYFFEKATLHFEKYLATADSIDVDYQTINKQLHQAKLGKELLRRVENITFIDSVVVPKKEAIKKIILSKEIGQFTQREEWLDNKPIDIVSFTTERGNKTYNPIVYKNNTDLCLEETLLNGNVEINKIKELNTTYNENYPFLMMDGVTLYFSSNNGKTLGGYDIFITQFNYAENHFFKPENIGIPFNSPFNDYLLAIDENKKIGWLVSDRYQKEGKVAVYRFIPNDETNIVKTDSLDALRAIAKISTFDKTAYKAPQNREKRPLKQNLILIKDNLHYQQASDFKSKEAQNQYYQSEKIKQSIFQTKKSLKRLRKRYSQLPIGAEKEQIASTILLLEKQLLQQVPQQKECEKKMRNLEIKQLKDLQIN